MTKESLYPGYDVWDQHEAWDEHTRQIVRMRKTPQVLYKFFTYEEGMIMQTLIRVLTDDHRLEVITYVLEHLDQSLSSPIGESQRKVNVLPKKMLIKDGVGRIEFISHRKFGSGFETLQPGQQAEVLNVTKQDYPDFFKGLLYDVVEAYYSHPIVWSDIGYGGPAYPRGYVRVEKGLVDPWEANQHGKS